MSSFLQIIGNIIFASQHAYAAGGDGIACQLVDGCTPTNTVALFLPPVASLLISVVAALSILFVVWGGLLMITSLGDDSKINNGKNSIIYALVGFMVALASQTLVSIVVNHASGISGGASAYDNPIIDTVSIAIGIMLSIFNVVFFLIVIATGFRLVLAHGKTEETDTSKKMLIFAIVGAIIINLSKSIVGIVLNMGL